MYMCPYVLGNSLSLYVYVNVNVNVSLGISKTNRHLRGEKRGRGQREEVRRYVNAFREQWMTGHARSRGVGRGEGGVRLRGGLRRGGRGG
jgi:hypothetical protein